MRNTLEWIILILYALGAICLFLGLTGLGAQLQHAFGVHIL